MRKLQRYQHSTEPCMFDFSFPFITAIKSVNPPLCSLSAMPPHVPYLLCWASTSELRSFLPGYTGKTSMSLVSVFCQPPHRFSEPFCLLQCIWSSPCLIIEVVSLNVTSQLEFLISDCQPSISGVISQFLLPRFLDPGTYLCVLFTKYVSYVF